MYQMIAMHKLHAPTKEESNKEHGDTFYNRGTGDMLWMLEKGDFLLTRGIEAVVMEEIAAELDFER